MVLLGLENAIAVLVAAEGRSEGHRVDFSLTIRDRGFPSAFNLTARDRLSALAAVGGWSMVPEGCDRLSAIACKDDCAIAVRVLVVGAVSRPEFRFLAA